MVRTSVTPSAAPRESLFLFLPHFDVICDLIERFSIAFTANVRLKFPVYQKLVKFIWFQFIFCLLATAMEQVLKSEK